LEGETILKHKQDTKISKLYRKSSRRSNSTWIILVIILLLLVAIIFIAGGTAINILSSILGINQTQPETGGTLIKFIYNKG